jgi:hypothetical protein
MPKINNLSKANRREFLTTMLPAGTFFCLGCPGLFANNISSSDQEQLKKGHKFQNKFCRTHEEAWRWRFGYFIDRMESFSDILGRDKLIDILKTASYESQFKNTSFKAENTFTHFVKKFKTNKYYDSTLTFEVLEESEKEFVVKTKECLWAKTFMERNAGDIGYASMCYAEIGSSKAYNPRMNLELIKNLMLGDEYCLKRYSLEV